MHASAETAVGGGNAEEDLLPPQHDEHRTDTSICTEPSTKGQVRSQSPTAMESSSIFINLFRYLVNGSHWATFCKSLRFCPLSLRRP
jgi:hypothetical protein